MPAEKTCVVCKEPFDWVGLTIANRDYCCAECASGKPCGCPSHAHGIPVPDADDPELVGLGPEDLVTSARPGGPGTGGD